MDKREEDLEILNNTAPNKHVDKKNRRKGFFSIFTRKKKVVASDNGYTTFTRGPEPK